MKTIKQVVTMMVVIIFMMTSVNVSAQTKELTPKQTEEVAALVIASFTDDIEKIILENPELFNNNSPSKLSFLDMKKGLGIDTKGLTKAGNDLLKVAYLYLQEGTNRKDIIKNYKGKEVENALIYIQNIHAKNKGVNENEILFGVPSTDVTTKRIGGCKWWQFRCKWRYIKNQIFHTY